MAKKQYTGNITFDASAKSIVFDGNIQRDRFLLITNVTDNVIIYNFADSDLRMTSHSYSSTTDKTTIVLNHDTTSMSDADTLQVFFEDPEGTHIKPAEDLLDPVSKMRVSQPENLIDTDFEYGLQGQKWETLEQVKNIPTFFARAGEEEVPLSSIETTQGSDVVVVTTATEHGYSKGTPFIIVGSNNPTINGGNIVTNRVSAKKFQFKAKATQSATADAKSEYTQLFTGNIYGGTEFRRSGLKSVSTDEGTNSKLTVQTAYPHRFTKGTELYLSNSLSTVATTFDASQIQGDDNTTTSHTIDPATDTDPALTGHWKSAAPKHDVFTPEGKTHYFLPGDISSISNDIVTFSSAHGLETGTYFYSAGFGNASFATDLRNEFYYFIHVHSTTAISFHSNPTDANNDNSRHNIGTLVSTSKANRGYARHYLHKAWLYDSSANDTLIDASNINTTLDGDAFSKLFDIVNDATGSVYAIGPGFDRVENTIPFEGLGFLYDTQVLSVSGNSIQGDFVAKRYNEGIFFRVVSQNLTGNGTIYKEDHGIPDGAGVTVSYTSTGDITINTQDEFDQWFPYRFGASWQAAGTGSGSGTGGFSDSGAGGGHIRFGKDPYYVSDDQKDELVKAHLNNDSFDMRHIVSRELLLKGSSDDWGYNDDETSFSINFKAIAGNGSNGGANNTVNLVVGVRDLGDFTTTYQQTFSLTSSWADYSFTATARLNRPFQIVLRQESDMLSDDNHIGLDEIRYDVDTNFWIGNSDDYHFIVDRVDANHLRLLNPAGGTFYYAGAPNSSFTINYTQDLTNTDTIVKTGHGLIDGSEVTYGVNGNTVISGLTDGTEYYIFEATSNNFKLATSETGESGAAVDFWQYRSTETNGIGRGGATSTFYIGTNSNAVSEGYTTGSRVKYTAPTGKTLPGLSDGGFYFIRKFVSGSGAWVRLYRTQSDANSDSNHIAISDTDSDAKGSLQKVTLVDIAVGSGEHTLTATTAGGADGIYPISRIIDTENFELQTQTQVNKRTIALTKSSIDQRNNAVYSTNHGLDNGTPLTLVTTGTPPGDLNDGSTTIFYVIRTNDDYFQLAATEADVDDNIAVTLDDLGTGTNSLETTSVLGEVASQGTVSFENGGKIVTGTGTKFTAQFRKGDEIIAYQSETTFDLAITSTDTSADEFTSSAHTMSDGDLVRVVTGTADFDAGDLLYIHQSTTTTPSDTFSVHSLRSDAVAGTNAINLTASVTGNAFKKVTAIGSSIKGVVDFVNSPTQLQVQTAFTSGGTNLAFALSSGLTVRANGFALHRPYDGGVDLIPAQNPDGQMIRQTRKYFRYQSGKGIQVSNGINFSPTVPIMDMTYDATDSSPKGIITTRYPHRLKGGVSITVKGATVSSGTNYWNGTFTIQSVIDDYKVEVPLTGTPADVSAMGTLEFHVNAWSGALVKSGVFDDQNGLFYQYDGSKLYCVHRSSTYQISGDCVVQYNTGLLTGVNTKFTSQLAVNDKIVIRGQTYQITRIDSNSRLYFSPSYRGADADGVIISKIVDVKVAQENWSVDPCDGTGPFGYVLDIHKMQMAYIDYSWYGAGKVRFGFKDQQGRVKYVHEFINNNKQTEAYMRSGNLPVRYEIENIGDPTFVPSLAHWGTSVIMDGRFDKDDSSVFTASSRTVSLTGEASLTVSGRIENDVEYRVQDPNGKYPTAGYAITLENPDPKWDGIFKGASVTGSDLASGTKITIPTSELGSLRLPVTPYFPSVKTATGGNFDGSDIENEGTRSLLLIDKEPTGTSVSNSNYTVTLADNDRAKTIDQPLISIRLAPSVDAGTPGALGTREIVNRMQLILDSCQVLTTHAVQIDILLNPTLDRNDWKLVERPSLSQLIYHGANDTVYNGIRVFSFKADGGTGTSNRVARSTIQALTNIDTMGNSILGGDGVFPDGPDVMTIVARLVEDPSTVSNSNPFNISGKISWSESQA